MTDREKFLYAINTEPTEDHHRLVYADYLQENGAPERAELIRVQVELGTYHRPGGMFEMPGRDSEKLHIAGLFAREESLLRAYSSAWRRPPCPECDGKGHFMVRDPIPYGDRYKENCKACTGTGYTGPLSARHLGPGQWEWKHAVTYVRGFPVVSVQFAEIGTAIRPDDETPIPWDFRNGWLAWAVRCVREEGASFKVEGREPGHGLTGSWYWYGRDNPTVPDGELPPLAALPIVICQKMDWYTKCKHQPFTSAAEANAALDTAVTALVVERAYPPEPALLNPG